MLAPMERRPGRTVRTRIHRVRGGHVRRGPDVLATEEPLEIRVETGVGPRTIAVTMRTPGDDVELAVGFLFGEGVVSSRDDVVRAAYCTEPSLSEDERFNTLTVSLRADLEVDLQPLDRHVLTTSACGVCGRTSLEAVHVHGHPTPVPGLRVDAEVVRSLDARLGEEQELFERTGGLHAAALFDLGGELLAIREDVGRHNALDKLVGWALLHGRLPLTEHLVMLSGRASYELLQKSVVAGIPVVCAVSAPSSLAVAVAEEFGTTLIGFLRDDGFNIYAGEDRLVGVGSDVARGRAVR